MSDSTLAADLNPSTTACGLDWWAERPAIIIIIYPPSPAIIEGRTSPRQGDFSHFLARSPIQRRRRRRSATTMRPNKSERLASGVGIH